jgi:UDP-galactopyranose mutase
VPTPERIHERRNEQLQHEIRSQIAPVRTFFCGRLATYQYIDQDQAIGQALTCAASVLRSI